MKKIHISHSQFDGWGSSINVAILFKTKKEKKGGKKKSPKHRLSIVYNKHQCKGADSMKGGKHKQKLPFGGSRVGKKLKLIKVAVIRYQNHALTAVLMAPASSILMGSFQRLNLE